MDLRSLNTFIQVAELGSFTRAGDALGYSQPTVSFQIRQLEEELGVRLFDRIGHTVRLTESGRETLLYAQRICRMSEELLHGAKNPGEPVGVVRLALADSLCAPLIAREFARFRALCPQVSLKVTTAGTTELFRLLDHNEVDLVCTLDSHIYDTSYIIAGEEKVGVHFVASAGSPLAAAGTVPLRELLEQPFLLTEKGMSYRRLLDERLARESVELTPVLELGNADLICTLVGDGMGLSFLPDYVTEAAVQRGTLRRLTVPEFGIELWKQLLYHRDKWVTPQMRAVMEHLSGILLGRTG